MTVRFAVLLPLNEVSFTLALLLAGLFVIGSNTILFEMVMSLLVTPTESGLMT